MAIKEKVSGFFKKVFTNTIVLYIILILAILNVVQYVAFRDMDALTFFVALGLVLKAMTDNNSIILLSCIIVTNVYVYVKNNDIEGISGFRSRYKTKKGKKDMKELDKLAMKKALGTKKEYNDMFSSINGLSTIPTNNSADADGDSNIETYNEITEAYNNLVTDIKKKTKKIKELSKKIKL